MTAFLIFLHITVCIALILIVLLQTGKGADMGATFGGSTQTVFGSSGPGGFFSKLTTIAAIIFMLTSLMLGLVSGERSSSSVMKESGKVGQESAAPSSGTDNESLPQSEESKP